MVHKVVSIRSVRDDDDEVKSQYTLSECLTDDTGDMSRPKSANDTKFCEFISNQDLIMNDIDHMLHIIGGSAGFMHDSNTRTMTPKYVLDLFARERLITEPFEEHRRYLATAAVFLIRIQICLGMVLPMATYTHPLVALLLPLDFDDLKPCRTSVPRIFNVRLHRPFRITQDIVSMHTQRKQDWRPFENSILFSDLSLSPTLDVFASILNSALESAQGALNMLHAYRFTPRTTHHSVRSSASLIRSTCLALETTTSVYAYNPEIARVLDHTFIRHSTGLRKKPHVTIPHALLHSSIPPFLYSGLLAVHTAAHWKHNPICSSDRTVYEDSLLNHPGIADPDRVSRIFTGYRELWKSPFSLFHRPQTYYSWTVIQHLVLTVAYFTGYLNESIIFVIHAMDLVHDLMLHLHAPRIPVLDSSICLQLVFAFLITIGLVTKWTSSFALSLCISGGLILRFLTLVPYGQKIILHVALDLRAFIMALPRYIVPCVGTIFILFFYSPTAKNSELWIGLFLLTVWTLVSLQTTSEPLPATFIFTQHRFIKQCTNNILPGAAGLAQQGLSILCVPKRLSYKLGMFFPTLICIPILSFGWIFDAVVLFVRTLIFQFRIAWSIRKDKKSTNTQIIPFMIPLMWTIWQVPVGRRISGLTLCLLTLLILPTFLSLCLILGPTAVLFHSFLSSCKRHQGKSINHDNTQDDAASQHSYESEFSMELSLSRLNA